MLVLLPWIRRWEFRCRSQSCGHRQNFKTSSARSTPGGYSPKIPKRQAMASKLFPWGHKMRRNIYILHLLAFAKISLFNVFKERKNGISEQRWKKGGMRDSREKGAGTRDKTPPPSSRPWKILSHFNDSIVQCSGLHSNLNMVKKLLFNVCFYVRLPK